MKYLFYRFYRGALFIRKGGDPEGRAWFVFTFATVLNFFTVKQFYLSFIHQSEILDSTGVDIFISVLICIVNFYLFQYKDNFKRILERYENESQRARRRGMIIAYLYVIVTIVLALYAKGLQLS